MQFGGAAKARTSVNALLANVCQKRYFRLSDEVVGIAFRTVRFQNPNRMDFLKDLWLFMKERKKFWLAPVIIVLLVLGLLIVFGGSSAVAPFIYTLF